MLRKSLKVLPEPVDVQKHLALPTFPRYISSLIPCKDIRPLFLSLKRITCMNALMTVKVIALSYLENELYYANGYHSSIETNFLRTIVMLLNFAQSLLVFRFYQIMMKIKVAYAELHPYSKV